MTTAGALSARAIVASSHRARLHLPGRGPVSASYVDVEGEPLLLLPFDGPWPDSRRAAVTIVEPTGAMVGLSGTLHRGVGPQTDAQLAEHRDCLLDPTGLALRLAVDSVVLRTAGRTRQVSCVGYAEVGFRSASCGVAQGLASRSAS